MNANASPRVTLVSFMIGFIAGVASPDGMAAAAPGRDFQIDAGFPGGNIIVERIEGDTVFLRPDLRETKGKWFYWCFRVRGAAGRKLAFNFVASSPVGVRGPAMSLDGGLTWRWLGMEHATPAGFTHAFDRGANETIFSTGMGYTEQNLRAFLRRVGPRADLVVGTLARSERGRAVEFIRVGRQDDGVPHRIAITARHHACEMMASYTLEGIVEAILADDPAGRWLRENVGFLIVPFMDKDGVEEGLQGKNRTPHDHARDYQGQGIYASVAAWKGLLSAWHRGRLRVALDLHCPALRGGSAQTLYFVGGPNQEIWARVGRFSHILAREQTGPLGFRPEDNLPHGKSWNTLAEPKSFGLWAARLPGIGFSTTMEIPYADVRGREVNAGSARALGRDLARAIQVHLAAAEAR